MPGRNRSLLTGAAFLHYLGKRKGKQTAATSTTLLRNTPPVQSMCIIRLHRSPTCPHRWLTIQKPCKPSYNFTNCPTLKDGALHVLDRSSGNTSYVQAAPKSCPRCDTKGSYDSNTTRVVVGVSYGYRVGMGEPRKGGKGG